MLFDEEKNQLQKSHATVPLKGEYHVKNLQKFHVLECVIYFFLLHSLVEELLAPTQGAVCDLSML